MIFNFFGFLKPDSKALKELKNILLFNEVYEKDSIDGADFSLPLYYLKLHNGDREFHSSLCLCKSELEALKTVYTVKMNYQQEKAYSLQLQKNNVKILEEVETNLQEVWNDDEMKGSFHRRLSEGITPYSKKDFKYIDDQCELVWDMGSRESQFLVKRQNRIILPKLLEKDGKFAMPFHFGGGYRVMVDGQGNYGVIYSKTYHQKIDYKVFCDFKYHYIRSDGFGNVELLENEIVYNGDYKKLICDMVAVGDEKKEAKSVLLNSTTNDEYVTVDDNGLLQQHTENGVSKKYQTVIKNFLKIKPVQCENGLWGFIDKNAQEIIPCKFKEWNFFKEGYCPIQEGDKTFLIDEEGNVCIEPVDTIIHYEDALFFVEKDGRWAVFKGENLYIDYIDTKARIASIKKEHNLSDEEVYSFLKHEYSKKTGYFWINTNRPEEILLRDAIVEKKRALQKQMYELPLQEYVRLFDPFTSDKSLREAGLWGEQVKTKDGKTGYIGWEYPASASLYDLRVELPVDGFGKPIEELELVKRVESE